MKRCSHTWCNIEAVEGSDFCLLHSPHDDTELVTTPLPCCVSLVEKAGVTCDNYGCFNHCDSDSGCEFIDYNREDT